MDNWYIGTIGFSYKDWIGGFYPPGTTQRGYLPYYCKIFKSVEMDTTFHAIPNRSNVANWFTITPPGFRFCLKMPRVITHELGLKNAQGIMEEFLDSISALQEKAGPILIQLPPSYTQDKLPILSDFLETIPTTHRYAIEFRHLSWYNEHTEQLLSQHHVCWVTIDYPNLPKKITPTTDFLYIRWIGINNLYHHHSYERVDKTNQLLWWLQAMQPYSDSITNIYGFFNNDYAGFAAGTCKRFLILAGLIDEEPDTSYQERLF